MNYTEQDIQELYDSCIALEEQEKRDEESFEEYAEWACSDDDFLFDEEEEWCYED